MPGPGGGSRSGGGSRGGSSSGGSRGGSRGGFGGSSSGGSRGGFSGPQGGVHGGIGRPPAGGFGRPPVGGFGGPYGGFGPGYHRPQRYGGGCLGGGCLGGGCLSAVFMPIILIVFLLAISGAVFRSCTAEPHSDSILQSNTGQYEETYEYDELAFQDYADAQYAAEFGDSTAYEDNLLIVFLTAEDYYDFYYIAWVGDHIVTDINYMFGNEETELGQAIGSNINATSYKYSLDSELARVVETMTQEIVAKELNTSFSCDEDHVQVESHLTNKTEIPMTEETVNEALKEFTETTGIPAVIVVEDMEDVF